MMDWKKVRGSQEEAPAELDTTSSEAVVYIRKNIERIVVEDEMDGTTYELWEYDECIIPRGEYLLLIAEQNRADIDFITAVSGIEL